MFHKGIVDKYDKEKHKGSITLLDNDQILDFFLKDFPNQTIEPKIGERVKCSILQESGRFRANCIVRLDYKNAVYISKEQKLHRIHKTSLNQKTSTHLLKTEQVSNHPELNLLDLNKDQIASTVEPVEPVTPVRIIKQNSYSTPKEDKNQFIKSILHNLSVKYTYREKPKIKPKKEQKQLNLWWVFGGLTLSLSIALAVYAQKEYKKYKEDQESKLELYKIEQNEEILRQKQKQRDRN